MVLARRIAHLHHPISAPAAHVICSIVRRAINLTQPAKPRRIDSIVIDTGLMWYMGGVFVRSRRAKTGCACNLCNTSYSCPWPDVEVSQNIEV